MRWSRRFDGPRLLPSGPPSATTVPDVHTLGSTTRRFRTVLAVWSEQPGAPPTEANHHQAGAGTTRVRYLTAGVRFGPHAPVAWYVSDCLPARAAAQLCCPPRQGETSRAGSDVAVVSTRSTSFGPEPDGVNRLMSGPRRPIGCLSGNGRRSLAPVAPSPGTAWVRGSETSGDESRCHRSERSARLSGPEPPGGRPNRFARRYGRVSDATARVSGGGRPFRLTKAPTPTLLRPDDGPLWRRSRGRPDGVRLPKHDRISVFTADRSVLSRSYKPYVAIRTEVRCSARSTTRSKEGSSSAEKLSNQP